MKAVFDFGKGIDDDAVVAYFKRGDVRALGIGVKLDDNTLSRLDAFPGIAATLRQKDRVQVVG